MNAADPTAYTTGSHEAFSQGLSTSSNCCHSGEATGSGVGQAAGRRHPEQKERQAAGNAAYWDSFWDADQVFYGHVLGFKGLERRAVVLVVNEVSAFERSRERLYVGLSRARDELVVCGDPDFIREVGGPDLARRLNLPST